MALLTAHGEGNDSQEMNFRAQTWRMVCCSERPQFAAGWGSFEHPDIQADSAFAGDTEICTFLVSERTGLRNGFGLGYLWTYSVFNVLYLLKIGGRRYERIGMGCLVGKET